MGAEVVGEEGGVQRGGCSTIQRGQTMGKGRRDQRLRGPREDRICDKLTHRDAGRCAWHDACGVRETAEEHAHEAERGCKAS
jgi:hypothetical protein